MNYITPEALDSSLMPHLPAAFLLSGSAVDELTCQICLLSRVRRAIVKSRCNLCMRVLPENMYYYLAANGEMYCTRAKCKPETATYKKLVLPKVEDELVACMFCKKKTHMVCGLINIKRTPSSDFICATCLIKWHSTNPYLRIRKQRFVPAFATNIPESHIKVDVPGVIVKEVMANFSHELVHAVSNKPIKYGERCFMVFISINGADVLIFIMFAQYYFETKHMYISYLDSVNYFSPREQRTRMYHGVVLGIIDNARQYGYTHVFIWSCPPLMGNDYIFNIHPADQKMPSQIMLNNWYIRFITEGIAQGVMSRWEPLVSYMEPLQPEDWPWFDGDYCTIVYDPENKPGLIESVRKRGDSLLVCHLVPIDVVVQDAQQIIQCDFVKSRCDFLDNCTMNGLQFNTVAFATHASYMILHFILNPSVEFTTLLCNECDAIIRNEFNYSCTVCGYIICHNCHLTIKAVHEHPLKNEIVVHSMVDHLKECEECDNPIHSKIKNHFCTAPFVCKFCINHGFFAHAKRCMKEQCLVFNCTKYQNYFKALNQRLID